LCYGYQFPICGLGTSQHYKGGSPSRAFRLDPHASHRLVHMCCVSHCDSFICFITHTFVSWLICMGGAFLFFCMTHPDWLICVVTHSYKNTRNKRANSMASSLQCYIYSAKATYNFKEPTNRSHPIIHLILMTKCMVGHMAIHGTHINFLHFGLWAKAPRLPPMHTHTNTNTYTHDWFTSRHVC